MRQDQFEKLQTLSEKLTDVFLDEADPAKWPGASIEPGNMDQQTRGDRYWCKKNAVATLSIVGRITNIQTIVRQQGGNLTPPTAGEGDGEEKTLDKEIASAEKEAERLLDKVQKAAAKREFDKHVHGQQKG